jgi:hypothetical protein
VPDDRFQWHPEVLPDGWMQAADDLSRTSVLEGFYLAGGTGLALQYGHRRSADLDLFREAPFESAHVADLLRGQQGLARVALQKGTAHFTLRGVKVSLLHYPYPVLFPPRAYQGLQVADQRDIGCMKIQAIGDRGSRRDFVDLYLVASREGLGTLFECFSRKYASVAYSRTHYLKALTYFADAEAEPMPAMLVPLDWAVVTAFFTVEAPRLSGLP